MRAPAAHLPARGLMEIKMVDSRCRHFQEDHERCFGLIPKWRIFSGCSRSTRRVGGVFPLKRASGPMISRFSSGFVADWNFWILGYGSNSFVG